MTTVFKIYPSRTIQEIIFYTTKGRRFVLHIEEAASQKFEPEMITTDPLPPFERTISSQLTPASNSAIDNFAAGVEFVLKYLNDNDPQDGVVDVHNPCNTPFISELDQNSALEAAGLSLKVRTN